MNNHIRAPEFVAFAVSPLARWIRIIVGILLMVGGITSYSTPGDVTAFIGLIIFAVGAIDLFPLAFLFNGPVSAERMRERLHQQEGHPELGSRATSWMKA